MMPDNVLSDPVQPDRYIFPYDLRGGVLEDFEIGGIALSDPSEGLEYQLWYGKWDSADSTVYLKADNMTEAAAVLEQPGVLEFSFTFDQNMRPQYAMLLAGGVLIFRWYDAAVAAYTTSTYTDISAFKVRLDDKRRVQLYMDRTDVILTYVRAGALYFRMQRDRYEIEYPLFPEVSDKLRITNFGMSRRWRLQWRFEYRTTILE